MMTDLILFAGTANPALATAIATELGVRLAVCTVDRFPDGETTVQLGESVRGRDVFLIQSTGPPVNDHLMELLACVDACRRSAAGRIIAVVPYFGYARSDKRHGRREPINASLVASLMQAAGIDHVVTVDLHAAQIEGFFHIPVDSLTAVPTLCQALRDRLPPEAVVVSPDAGRVKMATEYAARLGAPVVVLHKRRGGSAETAVTHVVGDVRGRACLIIDDMISTGETLAQAIKALLAADARPEITIAATHGLFIGDALTRLSHETVRRVFITDTTAQTESTWPPLQVVSVAPLLAAAIRQIGADGSLGDLFLDAPVPAQAVKAQEGCERQSC
ncbi:ribose-phosphate pyrophosphokinase [Singulisphaera sp. Ch08]|uniref:ribose-phosphate diphosphokinase n=1 Tax=Singulisphaera sp. Ch08 TaxID=3120278 RepID=A0AAU7CC49_9BACT